MNIRLEYIEEFIENPEDMSLCPLCDNVIESYEQAVIIIAHGCKSLAHEICVNNIMEDDEE